MEELLIRQAQPFGPILPLLKWSDEDDVIARANDTIYGLGASVWGKDLEAVERIGSQLEAGTVWLNEVHQYSPFQAFGGHKQSGLGCENSLHAWPDGVHQLANHHPEQVSGVGLAGAPDADHTITHSFSKPILFGSTIVNS